MKSPGIFIIAGIFSISVFGQDKDQNSSEGKELEDKTETKKEYNEDDNLTRYDSIYNWEWSDNGVFSEEFLKKFEKNIDQFHDDWEGFGDEFMSGFYLDEKMIENFRDMHKDFELKFSDSVFLDEHFKKFFNEDQIKLHGFNFNGKYLEEMPFDKEKMDELHKRMKDLFDGEYDERIKKFIEEHKSEIDEIRYQIRESIPNRRKAI